MPSMLGKDALAEMARPMETFWERIRGRDGEMWWNAFRRFLRHENPWKPTLLKHLGSVEFKATTERLFGSDLKNGFPLLGLELDDNFKEWFFKKTERDNPKTKLDFFVIQRYEQDISIIAELSYKTRVETNLSHFYALLEQQADGKGGVLLMSRMKNIFFMRDVTEMLRMVIFSYDGKHGIINAMPIGDSPDLYVGHQIFASSL